MRASIAHASTRIALVIVMSAVFFCLLALFSLSQGSDQPDFKQWSSLYLPDATQEDLNAIYPTWKKNAELVSAHNQQNSQFTMTLNKFAHLTPDQVPKVRPLSSLESKAQFDAVNGAPPKSFDWREHNVITQVHDLLIDAKTNCTSSLVVSDAISSLSAAVSKDLVQFSYRQVFECCWRCDCTASYDIGDCITKLNLCPTDEYPQQPPSQCQCFNEKECTFRVKGVQSIHSGKETDLLSAVLISPVMAAIDVPESLQVYQSGIYSSDDCSTTQLNHMVFVVGYGENEDGEKYWICKNSWGPDWGMNGYFLLARDQNNMCGIATQASYLYG